MRRPWEAARQATCKNHLHQIGLADEAYLSTGSKPYMKSTAGNLFEWGAHVQMLSFLDQADLFHQIDLTIQPGVQNGSQAPVMANNESVIHARVPVYLCPSETVDDARVN